MRAPGRVCLFGEHLDYLGLYVISAAIDLHMTVSGIPIDEKLLRIQLPDTGEEEEIDLGKPIVYEKPSDYLRAAVNVLQRHGVQLGVGCECTLSGRIPIQAGVSSSSAMVTAWIAFLLSLSGRSEINDRRLVARWAYEAEVKEFDSPGGMMDQYTSSLGGVLWIDCKEPFHVEPLMDSLSGIVLGDSLEKKETGRVLSSVRGDTQDGAEMLREFLRSFSYRDSSLEEIKPFLEKLPENYSKKVLATLIDRDLALEAKLLFESPPPDFNVRFGTLLTRHHEQLRDALNISTPKIEAMIAAAMKAGALGCKINGSGGGGCMFAYAPGRERAVARAIETQGGIAYVVTIAKGVEVDRNSRDVEQR